MKKLSELVVLVLVGTCLGYLGCSSSGGKQGTTSGAGGGQAGWSGGSEAGGGTASGGETAPGSGGVLGGDAGSAGHAVPSGGGAGPAGAPGGGGTSAMGGGAGRGPAMAASGGAGGGGTGGAPDVLILLDRSRSMNDSIDGTICSDSACAADSKWTLVTTALAAALPPYESTIRWGLKLFASADLNGCLVNPGTEVAPAFANTSAIISRLADVLTRTSTPTTAAETAAADYLSGVNDGAPKYIVLITDGIPTCGDQPCAPDASGEVASDCDDANAIAAVRMVHDTRGIPTMVIGVGANLGTGEGTLSQMAVAGGLPRPVSPAFYPVQTTDDLTTAVQMIAAIASR